MSALVDRAAECEVLDRLLDGAHTGSSGVLLLRGEPGIGKTSLLDYAIEAASDMRVLNVGGVQAEFDLPFAALQLLLTPISDRIEELPKPQRHALDAAVGRGAGAPSDRFLVGLAVLTLLSNAADEKPLVCAVDDVEWLDDASAEVLAFVARRLESEPLVLLLTCGDPAGGGLRFNKLPELEVNGLSEADSRELLSRAAGSGLGDEVRDRLVGELEGNPLALLELARELTAAQLSGSSPLPDALPLSARLEETLLRGVRALPSETQSLLLLVAAERSGEPDLLWRAADQLGISQSALGPAESVLRTGTQIAFRHGLVRAAVYASATEGLRRDAHLALAGAMDPVLDRHRAAWHSARASVGADESIAAELQASAETAMDRGGYPAAGAFLELSAQHTPKASRRATRRLDAVQAQLSAGALDKASTLLTQASADELNELQRAHARRLRASLAFARGENGHTWKLLLEAARELEPYDVWEARATYLQALTLTMFAGRLASHDVAETARAARAAPPVPASEATPTDLLLDGFALLFSESHARAEPTLRRAVEAVRDSGGLEAVGPAYQAAFELWDDEALYALATRRVELARTGGALLALPNALSQLGTYEVMVGRFDVAAATFDEGREISAATGDAGMLGKSDLGSLILAAWRGKEAEAKALAHECASDGAARGIGTFVGLAQYALSVLELGQGHYRSALSAAQGASLDALLVTRTLPELVEAAVRCGEAEVAAEAVDRLAESTLASSTHWGLGTLARSRALVAADADAEDLYLEAIDHLQRCRVTTQLARTRLVYGEWLRRAPRRREAREQLRAACEMFDGMGAGAFAGRAEVELAATGEHVRMRSPTTLQNLTPHEVRIARLAGEGATNLEIGAQLYISPRTVEYHLSKVFRKLGISSRVELPQALGDVKPD